MTKPFISSFCDEGDVGSFNNLLEGYTPCFTDVVILGSCRVVMILLMLSRIFQLVTNRYATNQSGIAGKLKRTRYHYCQLALSALCALVPLLQLNARIGGDEAANYYPLGPVATNSTSGHTIAPYEYVNFSSAIAGWALVAVVFGLELSNLPGQVRKTCHPSPVRLSNWRWLTASLRL